MPKIARQDLVILIFSADFVLCLGLLETNSLILMKFALSMLARSGVFVAAFLASADAVTGRDFSHRKEWIRRRMEVLASVFGIDVLSYAIMSNHLHLILRNRPDVVAAWSDQEVAIRWLRVFPGRRLEEHLAEPAENDVKTLARDAQRIREIRRRLSDISWFMRSLAEPIARMANKQDDCTGRFWKKRGRVSFSCVRV